MDVRSTAPNVAIEGRKERLPDVVVPLREQIVEKLVKKLEELGEGHRTVEVWNTANADRGDWLERQVELLEKYDEFLEPIYDATEQWSSTLHLPISFTIAKTFHARFFAALLTDPMCTVSARKASNQDRAPLVQGIMQYTLKDYANNYQGVEEALDAWVWQWSTRGCGILKARWDRKYSKYVDVVQKPRVIQAFGVTDPETGEPGVVNDTVMEDVEEEVIKTCFDGPMLEVVPPEDIVIVNGGGDPQNADEVIQQQYLTEGQLWTLADQKVFRESIVREIVRGGEDHKSGEQANNIKVAQAATAGTGDIDKTYDLKRFHVLERYAKIDVFGSGIPADVILWVHKDSAKILRATYLYRVNKEGLRPFFKIDLYKRHGQDYGIGLIELLHTLTTEIDAIHNMKVDFGIISSMPMGFVRAGSSMVDEKLRFEPGALMPVDNPQTDVFFPTFGNRAFFTQQEEASLYNWVERLVSVSDLSLGIIGGQGATRTATGTRALLGESNANLDVFLRRLNRGWKRALVYLFQMLQEKLPPGFQFRVMGDDGHMYWETVKDPKELEGMFDFELEPNSANSNNQIQMDQANQIYQLTSNPLDYQLGIFTPLQRYESIKFLLQKMGVRDVGRFIQKPMGQQRVYSPQEIADATLAGVDLKLGPEQDLQGFLDYFDYIVEHDELLGQFNEQQTLKLAAKAQEASAMMEAINAQRAQVANTQQVQTNAAMTTGASAPQGMPQQMPMATAAEG
jgi:hypothetical protein